MNFYYSLAALILVSSFLCAEGIFSGGTVAISGGGLLLAALGVKAIAGFGLLAASKKGRGRSRGHGHGRRRYGRSADDIETILNEASFEDTTDCAKKMVCEIHAKAQAALDPAEKAIYQLFGNADSIDVSRDTVQLDLAALVGRKGGNCDRVYARCELSADELTNALRQ